MERRKCLATISTTVSGLALAGCLSDSDGGGGLGSSPDCTITNTVGNVDPVEIRANGKLPDAEVTVDIRWNARVQPIINDDGDPPTGDIWLVVVAEVSNPSDKDVELGNFELTTETPDVVRENTTNGVNIIGDAEYIKQQLDDPILKPGGSIQGLLFYGIGEKVTSATFEVGPYGDVPYAFNPNCDESMAFPEMEETAETEEPTETES